jgi:hypothetical protein
MKLRQKTDEGIGSKLLPRLLPEMLRNFATAVEERPSDMAAAYMRLAADEIETLREKTK